MVKSKSKFENLSIALTNRAYFALELIKLDNFSKNQYLYSTLIHFFKFSHLWQRNFLSHSWFLGRFFIQKNLLKTMTPPYLETTDRVAPQTPSTTLYLLRNHSHLNLTFYRNWPLIISYSREKISGRNINSTGIKYIRCWKYLSNSKVTWIKRLFQWLWHI